MDATVSVNDMLERRRKGSELNTPEEPSHRNQASPASDQTTTSAPGRLCWGARVQYRFFPHGRRCSWLSLYLPAASTDGNNSRLVVGWQPGLKGVGSVSEPQVTRTRSSADTTRAGTLPDCDVNLRACRAAAAAAG